MRLKKDIIKRRKYSAVFYKKIMIRNSIKSVLNMQSFMRILTLIFEVSTKIVRKAGSLNRNQIAT